MKPVIFICLLLVGFGCEQGTEPSQPSVIPRLRDDSLIGKWSFNLGSIELSSRQPNHYSGILSIQDTAIHIDGIETNEGITLIALTSYRGYIFHLTANSRHSLLTGTLTTAMSVSGRYYTISVQPIEARRS